LFKTVGFRRATVHDIAERAGVSPATIYNHFGSKEGLVRDVVKRLMLDTTEKYWAIMDGDRPFLERLELIVFDKEELSRQYDGELVQAVASSDPEIQQLAEYLYGQATERMVTFFEEGRTLGYVNPELSREAVLTYLDILRKGILAHADLFAEPEKNAQLVRELSSLYLYGLLGKRDASP
ncbi:MAG: TetR/AcrR family transcriptional regulator, partial [Chloroflexota bacterium]|nr:TetR/AcrR family transcriptional regulator [Chloroflexota bacterium]